MKKVSDQVIGRSLVGGKYQGSFFEKDSRKKNLPSVKARFYLWTIRKSLGI